MSSIFAKSKDKTESYKIEKMQSENQIVLYMDNIKKTIPADAKKTPDANLMKTHIEWRWRFFDINGRKMVEISQKNPGQDRKCIDNTGKWINFELEEDWNKFLIDSKYYYVHK